MNLKEENEKLRGLLRECVGQIDLLIEVYVEDDVEPEDIAISEQIKADIHAALSQQAEPCEFHGRDRAACEQHSGTAPCETAAAQDEQEVAAVIGFYEGEREPRLLSWNALPNGEHRLYTRPAQTEQQPVGRVLTYEESLRSDGKSGPAFWFGPLPAGAFLYAAPIAQTAPAQESEHHTRLLGQALGECIAAAGIIRPDASLNGPELLMFADDLKRHLSEQTAPLPEQSGLADLVRIALHNGQLVPDPEMDGSTEVFGIKLDDMEALEAALSAQEVNKI